MELKKDYDYFKVSNVEENFKDLINKNFITDNKKNELITSDVIILPLENFREKVPLAFHSGTNNFYKFLRQKNDLFKTEICIEEKDYKEILLHSNIYRFGEIVLNYLVAPQASNFIWHYISKVLFAKEDDKVEIKLNIINKNSNIQTEIEFKGRVDDFEKKVMPHILEYSNQKEETKKLGRIIDEIR